MVFADIREKAFRRRRQVKNGSSSREVDMIHKTDDRPTINNVKALNAQGDTANSSTLDWNAYHSLENSSTWPAGGHIGPGARRSDFLMRKSCDFCGIRKRRCDGHGKRTCRWIWKIGNSSSIYMPVCLWSSLSSRLIVSGICLPMPRG